MSLEKGRTEILQRWHEHAVIENLEKSRAGYEYVKGEFYGDHQTIFIDTMLRIQTGDVQTIAMSYKVDAAGSETVQLKLPVMQNFERTISMNLADLEALEPQIRDLLPEEGFAI